MGTEEQEKTTAPQREHNGRPTQILETPNGHKVEVYEYIAGGEKRDLQRFFVSEMEKVGSDSKLSVEDSQENIQEKVQDDLKPSVMLEAQEMVVDIMVVGVDGNKENAPKRLRNLRAEDLEYVITQLDDVLSDEFDKKKSENQ